MDPALQQENQSGHEVRHHVLQADADTHAERARQDRDAVEIDAQRRDREDEPREDDGVVSERRDGVRHPTGEPDARVDVLAEDEANERRQQEGRPDRQPECHHVGQRQADRSAAVPCAQGHRARGPDRVHHAEPIQGEVDPGHDGEPTERQVDPALQQCAMPLHHEQLPQGTRAKHVGHESLADPYTRVQHQRDITAGEHRASEQPCQAHVAQRAREHGGHEDRELCPQDPRDQTPPSERGLIPGVGQELLGAQREREEHDPGHHLEQEHPLLQHRDDRANIADAIDEKERGERIDRGGDRGRRQPAHDQHSRQQDEEPHDVQEDTRRLRVDPAGGQQGQDER